MSASSRPASTEPPLRQLPEDHPAQAYGGLPARELLRFVQLGATNLQEPETQTIFAAFYYRYFPYLYTVVANSLGSVYNANAQEEIVNDTLAAFFRASHRLRLPETATDEGCDQIVCSYLGKLATWKAGDARSFHQSFGQGDLDTEQIEAHLNAELLKGHGGGEEADAETAPDQRAVEAVSAWMATLREVERDVIRTYFLDDHAGRKSARLPDGIAKGLADKHHTTPSNIRHLKLKLEKQIREKFRGLYLEI